MSCCHCCTNTLNLGCVNACDFVINTGYKADAITAGTWILELTFGRRIQYFSVNVPDGDTVIFTLTDLNEVFTYNGVIIDPLGNVISIYKDKIYYDCIQFQTQIDNNKTTILI